MFKLLFMLRTGALLLGIEDAHAQAKALPAGSTTAMPVTRVDALVVEGQYYADSFSPLRDDVRDFERDPANRYTYCIRNVATYECLSYASDGSVRRRQHRKTAHGTGFAYQHDGEETRILTNEHVVFWPYVTDPEHREENVPLGCKLVNQKLHIVDNEDDAYEGDDIALTRVIDDRALDAAVVRAKRWGLPTCFRRYTNLRARRPHRPLSGKPLTNRKRTPGRSPQGVGGRSAERGGETACVGASLRAAASWRWRSW